MKGIVTGGAGFIGSHLTELLLSAGHEVAVIDNLATGRRNNIPGGARFYEVDVVDREAVAEAFGREQPEFVCHYAAQASVIRSVEDPGFDARTNVVGGLNVLHEAARRGVKRFVFASTGGAIYGDPERIPADESHPTRPLSPYGVAKLSFEHYLDMYARMNGMSYAALRYANVFGPRQDPLGEAGVIAIFIGRSLKGERPTVFGDGTQTRDYVFVGDAVAAARLALESAESGSYNIGTGKETSVLDLVAELSALAGRKIEPIFAPPRAGEVARIALDASKARARLNWSPQVGLDAGLEQTFRWQRDHPR
jgi:UDP-glucose 4-epimerase